MSRLPNDFALSNLSRRGFLKGVGATGALVLAASWGWQDALADEKEKKFGADGMPNGWIDDPKVYVSIAADGTVTVVCNRSEMGQGVRTSLTMVVADELEADWAHVKVQQAPGDEVRFGRIETIFSSKEAGTESQPLPESSATAAQVGLRSARPSVFVSTSPVSRSGREKDPMAAALFALAGLSIIAACAAAYFVFSMQATAA